MTRMLLVVLLAVALLLGGLGWVSAELWAMERRNAELALAQQRDQRVRLALWRIDGHLAPLVAAAGARANMSTRDDDAEGLFRGLRCDAEGLIVEDAGGSLADLEQPLQDDALRRRLAEHGSASLAPPVQSEHLAELPQEELAQQKGGSKDLASRRASYQSSVSWNQQIALDNRRTLAPAAAPAELSPYWIGERLLLLRADDAEARSISGYLIDRERLEAQLLGLVVDLLPEARLRPLSDVEGEDPQQLAALPLRFEPGGALPGVESPLRTVPRVLGFAWAAALLASAGLAGAALAMQRLAERRAIFVSAVTHELRTPLTGIRLSSELLAGDMVADPERRREHLSSIHREAERLAALVDNVLAYARLERRPDDGAVQELHLALFLDEQQHRLEERCRRAGLTLVREGDDLVVRADAQALEQALLNLVDNAAKYAAGAADARVQLGVERRDAHAVISVRDHGPGLADDAGRRLFQPFSRSAEAAAGKAPGVGLGLALSRRLLRRSGGDLRHDSRVLDGARFEIWLPLG